VRRTFTVLAVFVVLVAVSGTAMAARVTAPSLTTMYVRPGGLPTDGAPVGMPGTTNGTNNNGGPGNDGGPAMSAQLTLTGRESTPGPVSLGGSSRTLTRGTALVGPTGGSVYTPKQRADREIKGLIRKLN
jgi:hypothetical protein